MTTLEDHIHKLVENPKTNPREFFLAWDISPAIIAERLRIAGFSVKAETIRNILQAGINDREELYLLSIAMMEMRNDITKTLYSGLH